MKQKKTLRRVLSILCAVCFISSSPLNCAEYLQTEQPRFPIEKIPQASVTALTTFAGALGIIFVYNGLQKIISSNRLSSKTEEPAPTFYDEGVTEIKVGSAITYFRRYL